MQQKPNIILGISPGTRSIGFAVMSDGELIDWGLKSFKGKWTNSRKKKILTLLERFVEDYQINSIRVKINKTTQVSHNLEMIYLLIEKCCLERKIELKEIDIEEIKLNCSGSGNKIEMVQYLTAKYPELNINQSLKTLKNQLRQYEAIGVTIM